MTTAILTPDAAFLDAVCATPDDVGPRLMYADWLEERAGEGDRERAEFIRVQCELDGRQCLRPRPERCDIGAWKLACGICRVCWLCRREQELLSRRCHNWMCDVASFRTATSAHPSLAFRLGRKASVDSRWVEHVGFRRGFVEAVTLSAADWLAHGPTLVRAAPIREVRLSDKEPLRSDPIAVAGGAIYYWTGLPEWTAQYTSGPFAAHTIPWVLWEKIGLPDSFASAADAQAWLSRACLKWARATAPS